MTPNRRRKQPAKQQSRQQSRQQARPRPAAADFWGTTVHEDVPAPIRAADDPTALVDSLGPPPLPNRELMARAYFTSAYDKAASLARALAAAGGLLAADDDDEWDGPPGS